MFAHQESAGVTGAKELPANGKDSPLHRQKRRATLRFMQTFRSAFVPLLLLASTPLSAIAAPKVHTVTLGTSKRVPFAAHGEKNTELRIRPLIVDGHIREWITGDSHDVTERSFVVRRILHINDTLPGEKPAWVWQPGPWLLVDRSTGHITALHLPDFDPVVSEVAWYRDYAAYCGVKTTVRAGGLVGDVWQIGSRKPALQKVLGKWPQPDAARPVCTTPLWQREPMRITLQPHGGQPMSFDVVGTSAALVEEGESSGSDE